ncbi:hypothetical protein HFO89_31850 [Rhizobium leguminosarum]|uniref:hypothetical protein n=1 Tax=Rhizobium leguminosarum TaxID=384 RepID=UPI001C96879F|nr:hypothetical protein [Rhizobium leguminosarum]MBY5460862.1 hypothetical protein [Rhizobium leguminosarum]
MTQLAVFPFRKAAAPQGDHVAVKTDAPRDADIQEVFERGREAMLSVTNRIEALNARLRRLSSGETPVGAVGDG